MLFFFQTVQLSKYHYHRWLFFALAAVFSGMVSSADLTDRSGSAQGGAPAFSQAEKSTFNLYGADQSVPLAWPQWPVAPVPGDPVVSDDALDLYPFQDHPGYDWAGFETEIGDINGDGNDDIIWNETGGSNRVFIGLGTAGGRFEFQPSQNYPGTDWGSYEMHVGDINGDDRDDIIWNSIRNTNRIYVGLGAEDGRLRFTARQDHPDTGWASYEAHIADVNGDGRDDLIWNSTTSSNHTYVGLGSATGKFLFGPRQTHPTTDWVGYETHVGDINGDGIEDLIWNSTNNKNRIYVGIGTDRGMFQFRRYQDHPGTDWSGYEAEIGDVNGDGRDDIVWNSTGNRHRVVVGLGSRSGQFLFGRRQQHPDADSSSYETHLADINGDGREDIVWNSISNNNRVSIGLGTDTGQFIFKSRQVHAIKGWSGYATHIADVDGDGLDDVVWNSTESTNRVYVGKSILMVD